MGGLRAIQSKYGDAIVKEQLELAINGKWQSITLANYERFKPQPKPWQQPEAAHPASKVFTAADFYGTERVAAAEAIQKPTIPPADSPHRLSDAEVEANWPPSATGGRGVLGGLDP